MTVHVAFAIYSKVDFGVYLIRKMSNHGMIQVQFHQGTSGAKTSLLYRHAQTHSLTYTH